jgi:large subunit ribosomal protein L17
MLSNMASSLILNKRINTTVAKAKELRRFVEPLITRSKSDSTHSRRVAFSYLKDKEAVTELFREVANKVGERPGGYTRIIKTGNRLGDAAEMCMMELVDFNELYVTEKSSGKKAKTTRRGRRKSTGAEKPASAAKAEVAPSADEAKSDEAPGVKAAADQQAESQEGGDNSSGTESKDDSEEKKD